MSLFNIKSDFVGLVQLYIYSSMLENFLILA